MVIPIITVHRRYRKEDHQKFEVILIFTVNSRLVQLYSKTQPQNKTKCRMVAHACNPSTQAEAGVSQSSRPA